MATNHYVNNQQFLEEMVKYRNLILELKTPEEERPRVPEYIGICLF